jgi:replication factor A1
MAVTKNAVYNLRNLPKKEGQVYTVQIIDIKLIASSRYRAIISDGEFFTQSLIGGPSQHFFSSGMVQVYQLIRINNFSASEINNGSIITLLEIEPSTCLKQIIGNPQNSEKLPSRVDPRPVPSNNVNLPSASHQVSRNQASSKENCEFTSVKTLTSSSRDFAIKARVTKKMDIKEWKNERGTGKLFSINIIDSFNEEISVTFFKEDADKFFNLVQEGKVYIFRNGQVKISNKKFQTVDNEYTICADKRTEIVETHDQADISSIKFNPVSIESLVTLQPGSFCDVCAGVVEVQDLTEIVSKKSGKPFKKRIVRIVDMSNCFIDLSLWNEAAVDPHLDFPRLPFILVGKSLKLTNFNGLSLTSDRTSQLVFNADVPQSKSLKQWLSKRSNWESSRNLSVRGSLTSDKPFKNFEEIKQECEMLLKEESYLISGSIGFIRNEPEHMFYTACKNVKKCKKKVLKDSLGLYRCESCAEEFEQCEFRYYLSMRLQDYSDALWVVAFDEVAANIVGISATELHNIYLDSQDKFDEVLQKIHMKRIEGVVKVKISEGAQGKKLQFVLNSVQNFDPVKSIKRNLMIIEELLSG